MQIYRTPNSPSISLFPEVLFSFVHIVDSKAGYVDRQLNFSKAPTSLPGWFLNFVKNNKEEASFSKHTQISQAPETSVRSSGRWNISRISSGVFPSIIRARARLVRSTNGFNWRLSAAEVSSQSFFVSIRMYFSSKALHSYTNQWPQVIRPCELYTSIRGNI